MNPKHFTNKLVVVGFFLILFTPALVQAVDKESFTLSIPLNEGIAAEASGNYDRAIESYRKVLFVDGADVETLFRLAEVLSKNGEPAKAYGEFKNFLRIAHDSNRITAEEKSRMIQRAEEVVSEVKKDRHGFGVLSFLDINVLLITFILSIAFLIRLFRHFGPLLDRDDKEKKDLKSIWVENYWEKQQEQTITGIPFGVFTFLMFALLIVFCILSHRILENFF